MDSATEPIDGIAIIGMAGRFPGARDLKEFWRNLSEGVESIRFFTREELLEEGHDPAIIMKPAYVPAAGYLEGADQFDPFFFGMSPREAETMDPQHRLFLEQAWVALEAAGYDSAGYDGSIGVFGGMNASAYLFNNLLKNRRVREETREVELRIRTDKDFLASQVAYKLGLTGPSFTVQAACSTSLIAVCVACQNLMSYQCDMALAGGVSVGSPLKAGSLGHGELFGSDGHCRAFDAGAAGVPMGSGAGVVVLKRLAEALADGDPVRAVIRGFAINNDGDLKVGYSAPSVEGQSEVVAMAQNMAGVSPETIGFIEAHGTATPLGDPIEIAALTRVFRSSTEKKGFCAVGSVKTNIGHLDAAAGVASLIKAVLALEHGQVPPSLNFTKPNPNIDFAAGPFFVNSKLIDWPRLSPRRRAGVSSFAVGGMNAHVVLEEAPPQPPSDPDRAPELLVLSARTETALETATDRLADFLRGTPQAGLSDVASTLRQGRRAFKWRRTLVCADREDAAAALAGRDPKRLLTSGVGERRKRPVSFLFPGLGDQYPDMGLDLYQQEPAFRRAVDRCCEILTPELGEDLRAVLYPRGTKAAREAGPAAGEIDFRRLVAARREPAETRPIDQTRWAQPAVFVVEYALAQLWMQLGVKPRALAGFSLGEYVAACLAGVFPLEVALRLVARRAKLIEGLPRGAMLGVTLPEPEARSLLRPGLALAAVSGAESAVLAGPAEMVAEVERELAGRGVSAVRLRTSHAFHSPMMEPVRQATIELLRQTELKAPQIPLLSNVTGTWMTPEQATDPGSWGDHLVRTVRFADNLREIWREPGMVLLEVGPGYSLGAWALQHPDRRGDDPVVLPSLRHEQDPRSDRALLLESLGRLWLAGLEVNWEGLLDGARRKRVELPTYPFERQRYWIEADPVEKAVEPQARPEVRDIVAPPDAEAAPPVPPASPAKSQHRRPKLENPYVAPGTPLEELVTTAWERMLRIDSIGIHDNFFALGGDSMLAPKLLLKLHEATGVKLFLRSLFQAPTIAEMARMIEEQRGGSGEAPAALAGVVLAREAVLDPAIMPEGEVTGSYQDPRAVFLTGATGYVGAFLLAELLERTRADVHCLVRGDEGLERIRRALEFYGLWNEDLAPRILPVAGDLAAPRLGIDAAEFDRLAARLDAIYHCGAWVNTTYSYENLKASNVLGTQEALRLAARSRTKPFHFVSTLAVMGRPAAVDGVVSENAPLSTEDSFATGYVRTKWVAEQLVNLAQERGLPTTVFRLSFVSGHSQTGVGNHRDLIWSLLRGCIQLGAGFEMNDPMNMVPVDYVSRSIVDLSRRPASLGRRFHLTNPARFPWNSLLDLLRDMGYPMETLSYRDWHGRLMEAARGGGAEALVPFLPLVPPVEEMESAEAPAGPPLRHDDASVRQGLAGTGIECTPLSVELMRKYVQSFVERGILPPPPQVPAVALGDRTADADNYRLEAGG
jgi:phthiocerol/phenolphthiocerol synthesis type-I polyketide synthase E